MLRDLKKREYTKNRRECTKIAKNVENNHIRLETSENYKGHYCIFFWVQVDSPVCISTYLLLSEVK